MLKSNLSHRPHRRISEGENPRLWWNYAITAIRHVIQDREEQWTWQYLYKRKETKTAYMRLFAKKELMMSTPTEMQKLNDMEKELNVADIKLYRTFVRRYLQMLRHEQEKDDDSQLRKDVWELVRGYLGDFATKDLDTAPSSAGWFSMLSWSSTARKEDPRWEETADEVEYVMGWETPESEQSEIEPQTETESPKPSSEVLRTSQEAKPKEKNGDKETLPESPQSYSVMAAKPLTFGIENINARPSTGNTFLLVDLRLLKGSLTLRRGQDHGDNSSQTIAAISFTGFRPIFQIFSQPNEPNAPSTWEFNSTLSTLIVTDESDPSSKFKKIVQAPRPQDNTDGSVSVVHDDDPDFDSKIWENPLLSLNAAQLSPRSGFNMRIEMRLEESLIFYHRQFVEEIVHFFRPPDKHETLNALFDAMVEVTKEYANEAIEDLRKTQPEVNRAALEFAINETRSNIIQLDLKAPLIIFPEEYLHYR
jgi:Repeating coiled region of VPS13/Vacuolar sorting-associated protein 13, N-terminal